MCGGDGVLGRGGLRGVGSLGGQRVHPRLVRGDVSGQGGGGRAGGGSVAGRDAQTGQTRLDEYVGVEHELAEGAWWTLRRRHGYGCLRVRQAGYGRVGDAVAERKLAAVRGHVALHREAGQ